MRNLKKTLRAALSLTVFATACADGPTAPVMDVELAAAFGKPDKGGDGVTPTTLENVQWVTPLAEDISVSKQCYVGVECLVQIEELKAYLTIPFDALPTSTVITMTALAGTDVNFEFGPHGTQFNRSVKMKFDAANTNVGSGKKNIWVNYWETDPSNVIETFEGKLFRDFVIFETDHFSGYAIAM